MPECTRENDMPPVVKTALSALNYLQLIELDQVVPNGTGFHIGRTGRHLSKIEKNARERAFLILSEYFDEALTEYDQLLDASGVDLDEDDESEGDDANAESPDA